MADYDLTYLSFGAGVQSTALLVCSNLGLHGVPEADVAIFADTKGEPPWVYENLERMIAWSTIRVDVVSAGDLAQDVIDRHEGKRRRFAAIPAYTPGKDGEREGMLRRQCSRDYKIAPIEKKVRELMGYRPRQRIKGKARALIGISIDEASRMRSSRTPWIDNTYPLVDARLGRESCRRIVEDAGLPTPMRSACSFCAYHDDTYWASMKDNYPDEFAKVVKFDEGIRDMSASGVERPVFLHRSCKPLSEVDFGGDPNQLALWDEECEGICGL